MLIKIPVAWLQAGCARFVWKPHQNKAQVSYHLAVVAGHLAVANTQAGKVFRPLWESYRSGRNFYTGCSGLIEDLAVAFSRKRLSRSPSTVLSISVRTATRSSQWWCVTSRLNLRKKVFYGKNSKHNPEKPYQDRASLNRVCIKKPNIGIVLIVPLSSKSHVRITY